MSIFPAASFGSALCSNVTFLRSLLQPLWTDPSTFLYFFWTYFLCFIDQHRKPCSHSVCPRLNSTGRLFCVLAFLLYPQPLPPSLACSKCSVNTCWINKLIKCWMSTVPSGCPAFPFYPHSPCSTLLPSSQASLQTILSSPRPPSLWFALYLHTLGFLPQPWSYTSFPLLAARRKCLWMIPDQSKVTNTILGAQSPKHCTLEFPQTIAAPFW